MAICPRQTLPSLMSPHSHINQLKRLLPYFNLISTSLFYLELDAWVAMVTVQSLGCYGNTSVK